MGQAKRRRQQLGALYGTPAGAPPPDPQALARLAALPPLEAISATLSRADQIEALRLLRGPAGFRRSFRPARSMAGLAEVVIWGNGETVGVELAPIPAHA